MYKEPKLLDQLRDKIRLILQYPYRKDVFRLEQKIYIVS